METIEIPRFLLDYFDSNTIHTPLASIRGYAKVMLKGTAGPLTEDQRHFLEIIEHNAERLDQHFSLVIHNQHYIAWDQEAVPSRHAIRDLIDDFKQAIRMYSSLTVTAQVLDDSMPIWIDRRHVRNALASIGEFVSQILDKNKAVDIPIQVFQQDETVTLVIKVSKRAGIKKAEFSYYESFLYVTQRVMELHGGILGVTDQATDTLWLTLVFPNMPPQSNHIKSA